jgi:hypothetical protein
MRTLEISLTKKNRKYFAAMHNGYKVKLLIDDKSESLELNTTLTLVVDDISVRTKYGTDVIFKLHEEIKAESEIITLTHRYNKTLVDECKKLAGKFENGVWIFPGFVADEVEELDYIYNSKEVIVELTAIEEIYASRDALQVAGYQIAKATGRDSGAKMSADVALISGKVSSGGSMKNWATIIDANSTIKMKLPENLLKREKDNLAQDWKVTIIN